MTPQLKSYYISHQNRILRQHFYVLYRLFYFVAKNVILAFEYYLDEMSDLQLSGNARLMRHYSQLPLRRTPLGPALSVRLREMSVL